MPDILLTRTGKRPLFFTGTPLATTSTEASEGPSASRWWEISLYETDQHKMVLHLRWVTGWQGEQDHQTAHVCASLDDALVILERTNPLQHVRGYPDDPKYQARQAALETAITGAFATAVSRLADELHVVEEL